MTLKEYIIRLLEIIGYREDKVLYADRLIAIFQGKAVASILKDLDEKRKDRVNELTKDLKDAGEIFKIFRDELNQDEVEISFTKVVQAEMPKIVGEFGVSLNQAKKDELKGFIESTPKFF